MTRRASLPGADELFRRTSEVEPDTSGPTTAVAPTQAPAPSPAPTTLVVEQETVLATPSAGPDPAHVRPAARRRSRSAGDRRPSGRERHEEKITVYVSPEELVELEQAKLILRAQHGLAVDRGRIVREALAMLIADLETKGDDSILVRRLRGL